jgi:hypothetical protein
MLNGQTTVKQGKKLIGHGEPPSSTGSSEPQTAKIGPPAAPAAATTHDLATRRFPCVIPDDRGKWSIDGDECVQDSWERDADIFFGEAAWDDFDIAVDVKRTGGNEAFGIWFRYQDPQNVDGYSVGCGGNTFQYAYSIDQGKKAHLAKMGGSIESGKWHQLALSVRGTRGRCFLDGEQIMLVEIKRAGRGRLGIGTWESPYRFRNIVVKAPDGTVLLEGLPDLDAARAAR